ncbi:ABC transporter substrate-binding protein [Scardovia wiggsiae]|uniref:ABC transporter substrate-binding protein n=1 Tax=Scardovia wiggsiae TaxID=230143 RepID=UPI00374F9D77
MHAKVFVKGISGRCTIKIIAAVLAVFIAGSSAAGCSAPWGKTGGKSLAKVVFMMSWAPDTNHIGVFVAREKGYYAKLGLDVDILAASQTGAEQSVSGGGADFTLSSMANVADANIKDGQLSLIMQVQQKTSAIWCSLASNKAIASPKDFDGKTFATFGGSESDAVVKRMIRKAGGKGEFDKVTAGTSTFSALSSGRADFGGFYATWEGIQAEMYGPKLKCFTEPDYGVPGNADELGIVSSSSYLKQHPDIAEKFVKATQEGYMYSYTHPDDAAQILAGSSEGKVAGLRPDFVKRSMAAITSGQYWGDISRLKNGTSTFGAIDYASGQKYFDFLFESGAYKDAQGRPVKSAPAATAQATGKYLASQEAVLKGIER